MHSNKPSKQSSKIDTWNGRMHQLKVEFHSSQKAGSYTMLTCIRVKIAPKQSGSMATQGANNHDQLSHHGNYGVGKC
jgi:hypothetical protein